MTKHKLSSMLFSSLIASLIFTGAGKSASAGDLVRIFTGGPAAAILINSHKLEFDQAGASVETRVSDASQASKFLVGGQIEGMTSASVPETTFKAAGIYEQADNFKYFEIQRTQIYISVHPNNPVKSFTHDQLVGILSGKIDNWKTINGEDRAIQVLYLKGNFVMLNNFREKYLSGKNILVGDGLTDKDGLVRRIERDPGALGLVSGTNTLPNFKPKFIATDISYPLYFIAKKTPSPAAQKVYDILKIAAEKNPK
jgi:hypothetical protein